MKRPAWLAARVKGRRVAFATKLGLGISAIVLLVSVAMTVTFYAIASRSLTSESKKWGRTLCENLALRVRDPLLAEDLLRIQNHVDDLKSAGADVVYAFVMDEDGRVLAHTFKKGFPTDLLAANPLGAENSLSIRLINTGTALVYDFAAPVAVGDSRLGVVRVGLAKSGVEDVIRAFIEPMINVALITMVLAVVAATLYARRVTRRINRLREHAAQVVAGRLEVPSEVTPPRSPALFADEIEQLSETFDVMTRNLRLHLDGLHAAERELILQRDQLIQAQKMEAVGKLAGGVAHEINTPLGIILGYSQLLQEDAPAGSSQRADLAIIERQAKVCRKIVADLLGFSRQVASAKMEMCFNNSILEAVTLVRHTLGLDHVEILTRLDDHHPIIYGDPEKLKQVWINLLNNGRDAMPSGGAILITSRLERDRGVVSAVFSDTGAGVSPENLSRLFEPFFSTKSVGEGTGLGLAVSFGIVSDHGGTIAAKSPCAHEQWSRGHAGPTTGAGGPGTRFVIELPLDHSDSVDCEPGRPNLAG